MRGRPDWRQRQRGPRSRTCRSRRRIGHGRCPRHRGACTYRSEHRAARLQAPVGNTPLASYAQVRRTHAWTAPSLPVRPNAFPVGDGLVPSHAESVDAFNPAPECVGAFKTGDHKGRPYGARAESIAAFNTGPPRRTDAGWPMRISAFGTRRRRERGRPERRWSAAENCCRSAMASQEGRQPDAMGLALDWGRGPQQVGDRSEEPVARPRLQHVEDVAVFQHQFALGRA